MNAVKYTEVWQNKPIEYAGLTFYPLTMEDYGLYLAAKAPMELLLSSLTPRLARLNWCACLAEIDRENQSHLFELVMLLMAKALRMEVENNSYAIRAVYNNGTLTAISINWSGVILNMTQMDEIRIILAEQNGYTIPDENWNPELVAATQYNSGNGAKLKTAIDDLIYSVAANSGRDPNELWQWPIRKFNKTADAIDRKNGFIVYTIVEKMGTKFKYGNPYPTWKFDRDPDMPVGFGSIDDIEGGAKGMLPEAQTI